jgi:hypothetical protein
MGRGARIGWRAIIKKRKRKRGEERGGRRWERGEKRGEREIEEGKEGEEGE